MAGAPRCPAELRKRQIGVLGLQAPKGGTLGLALTDAAGRLLATPSLADLRRAVRRGQGLHRPAAPGRYPPTPEQRRFLTSRDRHCRMPQCAQRAGWADHDHMVPHAAGGGTTCANLCRLCRSHHRLTTHFRGWSFVMQDDGTLQPPPERPPEPEPPPF